MTDDPLVTIELPASQWARLLIGQHMGDCASWRYRPCTCGLWSAQLAARRQLEQATRQQEEEHDA